MRIGPYTVEVEQEGNRWYASTPQGTGSGNTREEAIADLRRQVAELRAQAREDDNIEREIDDILHGED